MMAVLEVDSREIALGWDSNMTDCCVGRSSMERWLRYCCDNRGIIILYIEKIAVLVGEDGSDG